jgi:hypothetical protein
MREQPGARADCLFSPLIGRRPFFDHRGSKGLIVHVSRAAEVRRCGSRWIATEAAGVVSYAHRQVRFSAACRKIIQACSGDSFSERRLFDA